MARTLPIGAKVYDICDCCGEIAVDGLVRVDIGDAAHTMEEWCKRCRPGPARTAWLQGNARYYKDLDAWRARQSDFEKQWPGYCRSCGATGYGGSSPATRYEPEDIYLCSDCVEKNRCPRCGKAQGEEWDGGCCECGWDCDDESTWLNEEPEAFNYIGIEERLLSREELRDWFDLCLIPPI